VKFKLVNLVVNIQGDSIHPAYIDSALINGGTGEVEVLTPFVYAQGGMRPPPSLPPRTVNANLIGNGAHITGWCLAGVVMLLSIGFGMVGLSQQDKECHPSGTAFLSCAPLCRDCCHGVGYHSNEFSRTNVKGYLRQSLYDNTMAVYNGLCDSILVTLLQVSSIEQGVWRDDVNCVC